MINQSPPAAKETQHPVVENAFGSSRVVMTPGSKTTTEPNTPDGSVSLSDNLFNVVSNPPTSAQKTTQRQNESDKSSKHLINSNSQMENFSAL